MFLTSKVRVNPAMVHRWMHVLSQVDSYMYNLLLVNALCDPIIYAVRMREVRQSYVNLLKNSCIVRQKNSLSSRRPSQRSRSTSYDLKFSKVSLLSCRSADHAHAQQPQVSQSLADAESGV